MTDVDMSAPLPAIPVPVDAEDMRPAMFEPMLARGEPESKAWLNRMTLAHLVQMLNALPPDQCLGVIGEALNITGLGELDAVDAARREEKARADRAEQRVLELERHIDSEQEVIDAAESFSLFCDIGPKPGEYAIRKGRLLRAVETLRKRRDLERQLKELEPK